MSGIPGREGRRWKTNVASAITNHSSIWDLSRQRASCQQGFNSHPKVHLEDGRESSDHFILQFLKSFSLSHLEWNIFRSTFHILIKGVCHFFGLPLSPCCDGFPCRMFLCVWLLRLAVAVKHIYLYWKYRTLANVSSVSLSV